MEEKFEHIKRLKEEAERKVIFFNAQILQAQEEVDELKNALLILEPQI